MAILMKIQCTGHYAWKIAAWLSVITAITVNCVTSIGLHQVLQHKLRNGLQRVYGLQLSFGLHRILSVFCAQI